MSTEHQENTSKSAIPISVNGDTVHIPAGATIADLLVQLEMNSRAIAVEVNREVQPRDQHSTRVLQVDDVLEIVTLAGGG